MSLPTVIQWNGKQLAPVSLHAAIRSLPNELRRFGFLPEGRPVLERGVPPSAWGSKAVDEVALCMEFITKYCEPASDGNTGSDALTRRINQAQRHATFRTTVEPGSVIAAAYLLGYPVNRVSVMHTAAVLGLQAKPSEKKNKRLRI